MSVHLQTFQRLSRQFAAHSSFTGYLEDSDGSETETEMWTALVEGFHDVARKLLPVSSSGNLKRSGLKAVSNLRDPGSLIKGTASCLQYRLALMALIAHVRGIKDTLADNEKQIMDLLQIAHDPRIARARSYGNGSGKRVALHRRRSRGIRVRKAPVKVMLPARMVKLPQRLRD